VPGKICDRDDPNFLFRVHDQIHSSIDISISLHIRFQVINILYLETSTVGISRFPKCVNSLSHVHLHNRLLMDPTTKEPSPAPSMSAQSTKGFKGVIAKARLGRKDNSSTTALNGTEDSSDNNGVRNSVDSLLDKARGSRGSSDDGLPPGPSNLSKLIPGRVKRKKKEREEAEQAQREAEDGRGRSIEDQAATAAIPTSPLIRSRSTLEDDGDNSLVTIDSEES